MLYFVEPGSIVRQIWGKADTVLFIFAGAAAEFALNKAVDWLYYTGRLPADPLGRLFSTVNYASRIVFAEQQAADLAIQQIVSIHQGIEKSRGQQIPDWAYRDVLFMLIDYSIRSFELLERKLTPIEKDEVFDVFHRMGKGMAIGQLPDNYHEWQIARANHLQQHLVRSACTLDLYRQYAKHLGMPRYLLLKQVQVILVPTIVRKLLCLGFVPWLKPVVYLYKLSRFVKLDQLVKTFILPKAYQTQIKRLDVVSNSQEPAY